MCGDAREVPFLTKDRNFGCAPRLHVIGDLCAPGIPMAHVLPPTTFTPFPLFPPVFLCAQGLGLPLD